MTMILRAAWDYMLLAVGIVLFALVCGLWAVVALLLLAVLPASAGRRVGRFGAMWAFRIYLGAMEALGAWRLDLRALDSLAGMGPLIVAANHPCLLDAVLIVSRLPDALCVMKSALLKNFFLGPAAKLARYVRNDSLLRLAALVARELRHGGQLVIFPEGTRTVGDPIGPLTDAVGAISRRVGIPVQTVIIETDSRFLGKDWPLAARPGLPLTYRIRLGRRFDAPRDVRAFTGELQRYFTRELATRGVAGTAEPVPPGVTDVPDPRG